MQQKISAAQIALLAIEDILNYSAVHGDDGILPEEITDHHEHMYFDHCKKLYQPKVEAYVQRYIAERNMK